MKISELKARRELHLSTGLCASCPSVAAPGKKSCEGHLQYFREYMKQKRKRAARDGKCVRCWGVTEKGMTCNACKEKTNEIRKVKDRTRDNERRTKQAQDRVRDGLCRMCNSVAVNTLCLFHLRKAREYRFGRYWDHVSKGKCVSCHLPPLPGKTRCAEHLRLSYGYQRGAYARRKARGQCGNCGGNPRRGGGICTPCLERQRHNRKRRSK